MNNSTFDLPRMGKKKVGETPVLEERVKQGVTEEEVAEFLKIIRKSEYTVVEQLHRMPAQISILGLLIASEVHRSALLKILNETHMPTDISMEKFLHLVGKVVASNTITFTDDELPPEGTGHNKALHMQVMIKDMVVARVLVDNGSAQHVCPLITIQKLGIDK